MDSKMLYPLRLKPEYKERLWGSRDFTRLCGFTLPTNRLIGEVWLVADHPKGMSTVLNGPLTGMTLNQVLAQFPQELIGYSPKLTRFPLLIKLLVTGADLSVQVHPDDTYAAAHEQDGGKSELWYILSAEKGAEIVYGLKPGVTAVGFQRAIANQNIESCLNRVKVHPGEAYYIPPGLVHALGSNIIAAEVQQSSDLTYRIYDYNRVDEKGLARELHLDKAMDVIKWELHPAPINLKSGFKGDKFKVNLLTIQGRARIPNPHMQVLVVLAGHGRLIAGKVSVELAPGDAVVVPASNRELAGEGTLQMLSSSL